MKKTISSIGNIAMSMLLLGSLTVPAFAANTNQSKMEQAVKLGKQMVTEFVEQREAEYYYVKSIDLEVGDVVSLPDGLSFDVTATIQHELKAEHVEELPFVAGMMSAIAAEPAAIAVSSEPENVFDMQVAEVESYIGETTEMQLNFNVTAATDGVSALTEENMQLYALDSTDNKVAVTEFNTASAEEMFNRGYDSVTTTLMEIQESANSLTRANRPAKPISNYASYNRLAARDYAYAWWGPNDSNYNPAYSNWNSGGGDCANFVSQCIKAGGVPTDSTWKKDSSAWISTSALGSYMVNKGYATKESYLDTNAGNFATKPGHSVLVSVNNTVDVCYTAHNRNRKDAKFTSTELSSTYTFYVIKNY